MAQRLSGAREYEIQQQLDLILHSHAFARANRSQLFLRYVVEQSLADSAVAIKEYSIALDVFGRDASYDPSIDAAVRVEAGRLRSRLREYYAGEGRTDPVVIEVPKGSYRAVIRPRAQAANGQTEGALSGPGDTGIDTLRPRPVVRMRWVVLLAFLLGMLLGYAAALR